MYIFIAIYVYIAMYISHLLYPSINCFHILAMVDNAVVNTEVHISFFFFFAYIFLSHCVHFLWINPEVKLLDCMVVLFLCF